MCMYRHTCITDIICTMCIQTWSESRMRKKSTGEEEQQWRKDKQGAKESTRKPDMAKRGRDAFQQGLAIMPEEQTG